MDISVAFLLRILISCYSIFKLIREALLTRHIGLNRSSSLSAKRALRLHLPVNKNRRTSLSPAGSRLADTLDLAHLVRLIRTASDRQLDFLAHLVPFPQVDLVVSVCPPRTDRRREDGTLLAKDSINLPDHFRPQCQLVHPDSRTNPRIRISPQPAPKVPLQLAPY